MVQHRGSTSATRGDGRARTSVRGGVRRGAIGAPVPRDRPRDPGGPAPGQDRPHRPGRDARGPGFRVIDYKSGHGPSTDGRQRGADAPAPALRHGRRADHPGRGRAHAPTTSATGPCGRRATSRSPSRSGRRCRTALESYVAELVDRLRRGIFVVDSQVDGCEGFCDYRGDLPDPPGPAGGQASRPGRAAGAGRVGSAARRGRRAAGVSRGAGAGGESMSGAIAPSPGVALTDQQRRALGVPDASVALSAGAGCGKTMVLTERFLAALDDAGGRPLRALVALTFTEKAARELRQRIRARCRAKLASAEDRRAVVDRAPRPGRGADRHVPRVLHAAAAATRPAGRGRPRVRDPRRVDRRLAPRRGGPGRTRGSCWRRATPT